MAESQWHAAGEDVYFLPIIPGPIFRSSGISLNRAALSSFPGLRLLKQNLRSRLAWLRVTLSVRDSDRLSKYNQLLRIEEETDLPFAGAASLDNLHLAAVT